MKNLLLFAGIISILASHALADPQTNCKEQVKIAARLVWSLNSNTDMDDLTAEILNQKVMNNEMSEFSVIVNTPRFPQKPQKVPYLILARESSGNSGCFIKQITAAGQYSGDN